MNISLSRHLSSSRRDWAKALAVLALTLIQATATATPVEWTNTFVFSGVGVQNPLLQIGFNPQPEPPAGGLLSFGDPPNPAYPPDPVITHSGASAGTPFRLVFGMGANTPLAITTAAFQTPNLFVLTLGSPISGNATLFEVQFELGTSGGGVPIDWVAFDPQPEPPAIGAGAASFGADFTFDQFSDATLAIRLHDATGMPIALTRVPEPGAVAMFLAGVAAFGVSRVRDRRHDSKRRLTRS